MKSLFLANLLLVCIPTLHLCAAAAPALPPVPLSPGPEAIPTFECLGVSWAPPEGAAGDLCSMSYRVVGETTWREALPPWFDARNGEYRGSIVGLRPGTAYEVSLRLEKSGATAMVTASTWGDTFPVAKTVALPEGTTNQPLIITEGGTPNGYVLYTGKTTIDVENKADSCVQIRAPYVIVRGLTLRGAGRDAIELFGRGIHDVVIEDCDISGWGRVQADGWGQNMDAAVQCHMPGVSRLIVQRCLLHDPRSNANDWSQARPLTGEKNSNHPNGPQAVSLFEAGGNNIFRDNEVWGSEEHRFNDGLGGGSNFGFNGFPGRDSDVYGNIIRNAADDALEIEGGGRNVRVWGNYMDLSATGVASAVVSIGPLYVFRNVYGVSRWHKDDPGGPSNHGVFGKIADSDTQDFGASFPFRYGGGRRYFFHNTILQPPLSDSATAGAGYGVGESAGPMTETVSRNNIWHVATNADQIALWKMPGWSVASMRQDVGNDFDYDLCNGAIRLPAGQEAHVVRGTPVYAPGNGPETFSNSGGPIHPSGRYALASESPGSKVGTPLPNFNRGTAEQPPDMGAQEAGDPPMKFGVAAEVNAP
jgi:Right handed beta helix region